MVPVALDVRGEEGVDSGMRLFVHGHPGLVATLYAAVEGVDSLGFKEY